MMNREEFEDLKERLNSAMSEEDYLFAQVEMASPQDRATLKEAIERARERRRLAVEAIDRAVRPELYGEE